MSLSEAFFAAGCFWGVQAAFDQVPGVTETEVGYMGGVLENPTYERVSQGDTGYAESVKVVYDDKVVSYENLLNVFFNMHDPTTQNRQGPDVGTQYRSVIFYVNENQRQSALELIDRLNQSGLLTAPIVTEVVPAGKFYKAEDYHQKYFEKQGGAATCHSTNYQLVNLSDKEWQNKLSAEEYQILRQKGTERPFTGKYFDFDEEGTYVCAACGNPIFQSDAKFQSPCGWPSFDKAIPGSVREVPDFSHGMNRVEVLCARCGSHLGHVFQDGPTETGERFCINSGAMDFED